MRRIGIIFGMENTFPEALVNRINSLKVDGIAAEFLKIGGTKMAAVANASRRFLQFGRAIQFDQVLLRPFVHESDFSMHSSST